MNEVPRWVIVLVIVLSLTVFAVGLLVLAGQEQVTSVSLGAASRG